MDRLIGVFLVELSAACFGTNAIFARIGYDAGANPSSYSFFSAFVSYWLNPLSPFSLTLSNTNPHGRPISDKVCRTTQPLKKGLSKSYPVGVVTFVRV
jgi:hypothetical protein